MESNSFLNTRTGTGKCTGIMREATSGTKRDSKATRENIPEGELLARYLSEYPIVLSRENETHKKDIAQGHPRNQ